MGIYLQRDEDSETLEEKWLSLEVDNSRSTFNTTQFISYTRGFNCFVERPYYNALFRVCHWAGGLLFIKVGEVRYNFRVFIC